MSGTKEILAREGVLAVEQLGALLDEMHAEADRLQEQNVWLERMRSELFDACAQIIAALDSGDTEELENGYASARIAIENARAGGAS